MVFFTLFLLHTAESYAASERYVEYYNNNHSGDTNSNDVGKPVKPYTSASYEVTEKVDDIPDNRPKPGPVIPNYTVGKPINFAQNNRNNYKNNYKTGYDSEAENNFADDDNSGTKNKHFHKYNHKINSFGIKGKERSSKGDDDNDLSEYSKIDDYGDNDTEARAGFYDSLKEVVSDFKNKISKSFNSFFGNDDHSI
ncbi:hypothetical protein K1T71_011531 [Dendrolimus kikuchii]|uniref:Uncharacterized protein n=1 Tax=Dendrolimus kikuchii TaxID=765133 RepID=A0ACC1CP54_9NEOP|nr:hypothetical protein K1T71_011531 [Dendrolimus kikuchii]